MSDNITFGNTILTFGGMKLIISGGTTPPPPIPQATLLSYYGFNEEHPLTIYDYNGSINGTSAFASYVNGINGKGITNCMERINFGDNFNFEKTDKFSFVFWYNISSSFFTSYELFGKGTMFAGGYNLTIDGPSEYMSYYLYDDWGNMSGIQLSTSSISKDTWHFYIITYDGSNTYYSNSIKVYIDNVLQTDTITDNTSELGGTMINFNDFKIAANIDQTFKMDEFMIFSGELTESQRDYWWNNGSGTFLTLP